MILPFLVAAFAVVMQPSGRAGATPVARGPAGSEPRVALRRTIPMPGVRGRIDHLACDPEGKRLYVAALGNGSLEVLDLTAGARAGTVAGLDEPQGVAFVPATGQVVVACGGDGTVRAIDAATLEEKRRATVGADADNVHLDNAGGAVWVAHSDGAVSRLDAATLETRAEFRLARHPEGFAVEPDGSRIYVNVPGGVVGGGGAVAAIDPKQAGAPPVLWELKEGGRNFPMALDGANHRLYVGCRRPSRLLVLDTRTGAVVASPECAGDADDVFVDVKTGRIVVIGGDDGGGIDVFETPDHVAYRKTAGITTAPGARTGLLSPDGRTLWIAAPKRAGRDAEIREYALPT